jgi:hypothetical protein
MGAHLTKRLILATGTVIELETVQHFTQLSPHPCTAPAYRRVVARRTGRPFSCYSCGRPYSVLRTAVVGGQTRKNRRARPCASTNHIICVKEFHTAGREVRRTKPAGDWTRAHTLVRATHSATTRPLVKWVVLSGMHTCGWCSEAPPVNVLHSGVNPAHAFSQQECHTLTHHIHTHAQLSAL